MRRPMTSLLVPMIALVAVLASATWLVTQEHDGRQIADRSGDRDGLHGRAGIMGAGMMGAGGMGAGGMGAGVMGAGGMGAGMMGAGGMMGGLEGDGRPVSDLQAARDRAERFARTLGSGLRVGEVIRFANNYYAELEGPGTTMATEVLVDPRTGSVQLEFGPAMMWNTRYGMMAAGSGSGTKLTAAQASAAAERWLSADGLTVGEPTPFPGYYTMETLRDGRVQGMLSVHAGTGAVWSHGWHGRFLAVSEG